MKKLLFSQRKTIGDQAVDYLRRNNVDTKDATNIIGALQALGYRLVKLTGEEEKE